MYDYRLTIRGARPILSDAEVEIPRYGLALEPLGITSVKMKILIGGEPIKP
jgi:hypothetical protein